jgi:hypothetical protein
MKCGASFKPAEGHTPKKESILTRPIGGSGSSGGPASANLKNLLLVILILLLIVPLLLWAVTCGGCLAVLGS